MLNKCLGIAGLFLMSFSLYGQHDSTSINTTVLTNDSELEETKSTLYFSGQVFNAHRTFSDLSNNMRYDSALTQQPTITGGFETGVHMTLSNHFYLGVGANYFGGGESWTYSDSLSDSTYSYVNKFRQIAVPIRLNFHFGNAFKGYGFVGAIPSSILTRRFESSFTNAGGVETENDIVSSEENINSFQFIGSVGAGFSYSFEDVGFFAQLEYRHYFTNTYTGLFLTHNQTLLGGSVGLTYSF
ncbi:MAG: outer membrane beta-barrel protein [Crocinitomicaceae bacterium]